MLFVDYIRYNFEHVYFSISRLALSLAWCRSCIILDGDFRVCVDDVGGMKYSSIKADCSEEFEGVEESNKSLITLQESLSDATKPLPQLMALCKTTDQVTGITKAPSMQ